MSAADPLGRSGRDEAWDEREAPTLEL